MKNVLLLGDSIRIGYDKAVKKALEGKANVYFPKENCRFAAYLLRTLHEYVEKTKCEQIDVIHWNAGLWDCLRLFDEDPQTPVEFYAYFIDRLCARMKKLCPNAHVIFATSTRVIEEKMPKPFSRFNADIEKYNEAAINVVKKYGFEVNDLYAVSAALPEEAHSDAVHFYTPMGTEAFAKQTLSFIAPALGIEEELEYSEEMYTNQPVGI